MALAFSASNLLQFYTFISPIFISLFLLLKSTMEYNMKGIVYIIGLLINYVIGMLIKTVFYGMDRSKIAAGRQPQWQRTPVKMGWPMHPGQTASGMPDYCNVFEGPWFNSALGATSMPSLNAMFHAFTLAYLIMGVSTNPYPAGVPFVIIVGITALCNMFYRTMLYCDKFIDIIVGVVLGACFGVGWWFAIDAYNPTYTFYGKESNTKQCKLSKTKFRCTYG